MISTLSNKKYDMIVAQVREITDCIEDRTGFMYSDSSFDLFKILVALGVDRIGLPTVEDAEEQMDYIEEHYPELELHDEVDYLTMILNGELSLFDTQLETKAAVNVLENIVVYKYGYALFCFIKMVQREIA